MRGPRLSPSSYRRITLIAVFLLGIIIVTGGAVRLSGSGLGCSDWPNCEPGSLVPHEASDVNAMIEFLNRVFTGLVSVSVIICVLGALRRVPRRRDLIWLAWGLVVGVFAQAVLGGLTVLFELRPEFVMSHFLLSVVLVTNALVLYKRSGEPEAEPEPIVAGAVVRGGRVLLGVAGLVLVTGTIVTSTGPHGGDEEARRFDFHLPDVARIHGAAVVVFLLLLLATVAWLRRLGVDDAVRTRLLAVVLVAGMQAAIGWIQYFNDTPALLVGFHIAGATALWSAVLWYHLGLFGRGELAACGGAAGPDAGLVAADTTS